MQKGSFGKDIVVKKGPPKCLSEPEIAENYNKLVLNREGNGYKGYGEEHNWTHICALWELLYAHELILMHNIDVMHQECNVVESIVSTCLNITGKRKDNFNARWDTTDICNCLSLELNERGGKRHAPFCLKVKNRKEVMRWMKRLKFPVGYVVGVKWCVNVMAGKIHGLKSHDYHIIMERLLTACNVTWIPWSWYLGSAIWVKLFL
jgi:hypothetical protein